jgi:excisionase family DNA binding protein
MADDEMTIPEAAALLGITRQVMRRAIRRRNIPTRQVGARVLLVKRDDIEAYDISRRKPAGEKEDA